MTDQTLIVKQYNDQEKYVAGNVVYFMDDSNMDAVQGEQYQLKNFPNYDWWERRNIFNTEVIVNFRNRNTDEQFSNASKLNTYNNHIIITPLNPQTAKYISIVDNIIFWNTTEPLFYVYISRHEDVLKVNKIQFDGTLCYNLDNNKLGVKHPIPLMPRDDAIYTLKCQNGKLFWINENGFIPQT